MEKQNKLIPFLILAVLVGGSFTVAAIQINTAAINSARAAGPIKVTDSLNRTFSFSGPVTRIVSIDPAATATLYALGAYRDIVGGNSLDSYPPNSTIPSVGNSYGINYEEVVSLNASVVLFYGANMTKDTSYINDTLHIPVLVDNPSSFRQIESFTHMLGVLTGTVKNASLINGWMNKSLNAIRQGTSKITQNDSVFYYLSNYGGYWTAGKNTFFDSIFNLTHLTNIATGNGYYTMSGEDITVAAPQIILLDQYVNYSAVTQEPFSSTPAYQNNRIYSVFNDNFFDQPDFRVVYAAYWVATVVYPSSLITMPAFPLTLQYPPITGF